MAGFDVMQDAVQVRRKAGLLTEYPGLYARMRAPEYLSFFAELYGVPESRRRERIPALLEQFRLWDVRCQPLALRVGLVLIILHPNGTVSRQLLETSVDFVKVFVFLVVPLLLIAAAVETQITPWVIMMLYR